MASNARWALLAVLIVLLVGPIACGDDDSSSDNSGERTSQQANGVASKPPEEILDDAAAAVEKARSFHIEGTLQIEGERTAVKADYERPSKLRMSLVQGPLDATVITTGESVFIKANEAFWKQQKAGEEAASALAGRWFKAPTSDKEIRNLTEDLDPKTLSHCLTTDHGTLERGGKAQVDGRPAVVLLDKGNRPGTAPGKLLVATTGEPYPLQVLLTGDSRPGGKPDPRCDDEDDGDNGKAGDQLTFSRYNEALGIAPPPKPVDLSQEGAGRSES